MTAFIAFRTDSDQFSKVCGRYPLKALSVLLNQILRNFAVWLHLGNTGGKLGIQNDILIVLQRLRLLEADDILGAARKAQAYALAWQKLLVRLQRVHKCCGRGREVLDLVGEVGAAERRQLVEVCLQICTTLARLLGQDLLLKSLFLLFGDVSGELVQLGLILVCLLSPDPLLNPNVTLVQIEHIRLQDPSFLPGADGPFAQCQTVLVARVHFGFFIRLLLYANTDPHATLSFRRVLRVFRVVFRDLLG